MKSKSPYLNVHIRYKIYWKCLFEYSGTAAHCQMAGKLVMKSFSCWTKPDNSIFAYIRIFFVWAVIFLNLRRDNTKIWATYLFFNATIFIFKNEFKYRTHFLRSRKHLFMWKHQMWHEIFYCLFYHLKAQEMIRNVFSPEKKD